MIEVVELTLTKFMAGTFLHRNEARIQRRKQIIFPVWNDLSVSDYLFFSKLSDEQLKQKGITKYSEWDRIYEVGDKDVVVASFDCVGNMFCPRTNIEFELENIGIEDVFKPHSEQLRQLLQPIVDTMKPNRNGDVEVTWRVLTLWNYEPNCTHNYYDGDDCDPEITLIGLLDQSTLEKIAKGKEQ